mgnify:CR=1 FL=1
MGKLRQELSSGITLYAFDEEDASAVVVAVKCLPQGLANPILPENAKEYNFGLDDDDTTKSDEATILALRYIVVVVVVVYCQIGKQLGFRGQWLASYHIR